MHSTVFLPTTDLEFTLGRDHIHADRRAEVDHDRRGGEFGVGGQAIDDPVGTHLLGVVDEQRDTGTHTGFDEDVGYRRPVLAEHHADLV
jgi:hypothetical protein